MFLLIFKVSDKKSRVCFQDSHEQLYFYWFVLIWINMLHFLVINRHSEISHFKYKPLIKSKVRKVMICQQQFYFSNSSLFRREAGIANSHAYRSN